MNIELFKKWESAVSRYMQVMTELEIDRTTGDQLTEVILGCFYDYHADLTTGNIMHDIEVVASKLEIPEGVVRALLNYTPPLNHQLCEDPLPHAPQAVVMLEDGNIQFRPAMVTLDGFPYKVPYYPHRSSLYDVLILDISDIAAMLSQIVVQIEHPVPNRMIDLAQLRQIVSDIPRHRITEAHISMSYDTYAMEEHRNIVGWIGMSEEFQCAGGWMDIHGIPWYQAKGSSYLYSGSSAIAAWAGMDYVDIDAINGVVPTSFVGVPDERQTVARAWFDGPIGPTVIPAAEHLIDIRIKERSTMLEQQVEEEQKILSYIRHRLREFSLDTPTKLALMELTSEVTS